MHPIDGPANDDTRPEEGMPLLDAETGLDPLSHPYRDP